jgi:CRISPR/Cas system CSM-associated protein Csm3 (group 7 of RAMP superfamily)
MTFRAITATLRLRTSLHVGTGEGTETVDDLLRRDARGRPIIPGTALAGALRSIATRLAPRLGDAYSCHALTGADASASPACLCLACKLFGTVNPKDEDRRLHESEEEWLKRTGRAAGVLVYDATLDGAPGIQIRDGVGIDRETGAAARRERIKFDLEVLPAGMEFKLRMELAPLFQDEKALQLLAVTLAEWRAGRGAVGGRVSRGLGAFELLDDVQFIERDLNQPDTLMAFLRDGPPWSAQDGDKTWVDTQVNTARPTVTAWTGGASLPVARSWVLAEFTLAATGPFLTHDLVQAGRSGFDHAPVLAAYKKGARAVLPGSSLRGVLRSQAERIARTLATFAAWDGPTDSVARQQHFFRTCPACNPLTTRTDDCVASCNSFIKTTLSKAERSKLERKGPDDKLCMACRLFGSPWNGSRLRVEDAPLRDDTTTEYKVMDFLAIDRFTGGGLDGAKFDAVVLWKPNFSVRLFLDNPQPWELGWLVLVLRDLDEGLAAVGFGRAKGFGQCTIEDRKLTLGILSDADFPLPECEDNVTQAAIDAWKHLQSAKGPASGVYQTIQYSLSAKADWLALANGWVKAFCNMVANYVRPDGFVLRADSYFTNKGDYWLPKLYPARVS